MLSDIRHSLRGLARSPLFTTVAIASLALGLGANTAIFNLLDQALLRPLPVKKPSELVMISAPGPNWGMFSGDNSDRLFSRPFYIDLRDRNEVFSGLIARFPYAANFVYQGQSESVAAEIVSGNFFDVLGVTAHRGRLLTASDDVKKSGHPVVVLGYGFWETRFGGAPDAVGKSVRVNNALMTIVGVAPRGFFGVNIGRNPDVYVPLAMKAEMTPTWDRYDDRTAHYLHILGRLKPNTTIKQATPSLQVIRTPILEAELAQIKTAAPRFRDRFLSKPIVLTPAYNGVPTFREQTSTPLYVLMAMVGLVLLIACANVANLLVARALGRQKEVAIRLAIGASRSAIVRQLLTESLVLAALGAFAALIVSAWTSSLLIEAFPNQESGGIAMSASLDPRTIAFTSLLALVTGIGFGLLPAIQSTRPNVYPTLKDQGGSVVGGFGQIRSRQALVVAQVALSLLLLVGAGLFTRSLVNLRRLDPGFQTSNMVEFSLDASRNGYTPQRIREVYETVQDQLASVPGVRSAGLNDVMLLAGDNNTNTIHIAGYKSKQDEDMNPKFSSISPGYFATLGTALLQGRDFTVADRAGSPKVAIVNESFVNHYLIGESPLGRRFGMGGNDGPTDYEIVGVVKDTKYDSLRNDHPRIVYVPYLQDPAPGYMTVEVRTAGSPEALMPTLRRQVAKIDPNLALWDLKTMETQINESLLAERLTAWLCAAFGALATILASIGLYGVTAFSVARRTREIGIRMALGARQRSVLGMVLKEVMWMCAVGICLGIPLAIGLSRYLISQLYGVAPADPFTLIASAVIMMMVSIAAGFLPAHRAANVDPTIALRYE